MKTIYFVRHGEAEANARGLLAGGNDDSPLTQKGEQQAHELAASVKDLKIDLIASSHLVRAKRTAEILAKEMGYQGEIVQLAQFGERNMGDASGKPQSQGYELLDSGKAVGVETADEFCARVAAGLDELRKLSANTILLVAHSGTEKMVRTILTNGDPKKFYELKTLENAKIYQFDLH
jgi:broad specificity phosphatase PhoE